MKANQQSSKIKTWKKAEIKELPYDNTFDSLSGKVRRSAETVLITELSACQSNKTNLAILQRKTGQEEVNCIQAWCVVTSALFKHMVWYSHNDKVS